MWLGWPMPVPPIPAVVLHNPGSCSWEERLEALLEGKFLSHWLHIELFLLNAASALKEDKFTSSLPGCSG